jgi:hypothetical protein
MVSLFLNIPPKGFNLFRSHFHAKLFRKGDQGKEPIDGAFAIEQVLST